MRKMQDLNPKLQALQKKYANDKEKLNVKMQELYKKEGVNPLSGCLPILLSMPILFIMFGAMRSVANTQTIHQAFSFITGEAFQPEGFLWIKNLWMPDSPFYPSAPTADLLRAVSLDEWKNAFDALSQTSKDALLAAIPDLSFNNAQEVVAAIDAALQVNASYIESTAKLAGWENINLLFFNMSVFKHFNGWLVLPILAAVTQYISTKLMPQPTAAQPEGAAGNSAMMKWFMPLFSIFICVSSNASFALYWVAANVFATAETLVINKHLDAKALASKEA